jgi:hypothetical protein
MFRPVWCGLILIVLLAGCAGAKYSQLITEQKTIPRVLVKVSHKADGIYQVEVHNNLPGTISLQWNSSAYLNTGGDTVRLIHLENVDVFPETVPVQQLPTPIARGGRLKAYFVGDSWMDYARRGVTPKPMESRNKANIYLAFQIEGKRVYWKGVVTFLPVNK